MEIGVVDPPEQQVRRVAEVVPEPDGFIGPEGDGQRAEPASLRLDPLDQATAMPR